MALYENEHRKQCAGCKIIKNKTSFGFKNIKGSLRINRKCDECLSEKEVRPKKIRDHWTNEIENKEADEI